MRLPQPIVRIKHRLFFARVSAARNPHRPGGSLLLADLAALRDRLGGRGEIELDVANHMRACGIRTNGTEALRIALALCRDHHAVRQRLSEEAPKPAIARHGPWGNTRAREYE